VQKRKKKEQTKILYHKSSSFLKFSSSSSLFSEVWPKDMHYSNKIFAVPAWNKWVVIALEMSFSHYRIRIALNLQTV